FGRAEHPARRFGGLSGGRRGGGLRGIFGLRGGRARSRVGLGSLRSYIFSLPARVALLPGCLLLVGGLAGRLARRPGRGVCGGFFDGGARLAGEGRFERLEFAEEVIKVGYLRGLNVQRL